MPLTLKPHELNFIQEASVFLDQPSALIRATDRLGKPLDQLQNYLPPSAQQGLKQAVDLALKTALRVAIKSLPQHKPNPASWDETLSNTKLAGWQHTAAVTMTGAIGGALGTAGLLLELPLTTSLILRSIASMAKQWGHDLSKPEIQLQCLYVFTLGSPQSTRDDEMDSAYISARLAYRGLLNEVAGYIGSHSIKEVFIALERGCMPALAKFINLLIPSFHQALTRNILAHGLPILGAVGAAALNAGFCQYFTRAARYHFGLLHLEGRYSQAVIHHYYPGGSHFATAC